MRYILFLILTLLISLNLHSQVVGKVTDYEGKALPFVNVYIENSYIGTTTNDDGNYKLAVEDTKEITIIFQFLGYKTIKKTIVPKTSSYLLNVTLDTESVSLDEVLISSGENPANRIIQNAIQARKANLEKTNEFTADFYSRGIWRVEDAPKKILGQEVGDFDGALDSTRTGIIYLSETISEIAYQKPNNFKERIVASKVSGKDNGFSFNSAQDANFSFYENTIEINASLVSPIANNAFGYYNYKLEGVFYENSQLINKIQVTPKRENDRVFSGTIYIVDDIWQIYGVELATNGTAIQVPMVEKLLFKQNFKFDETKKNWIKISQTIDFGFAFIGFKGNGKFTAVYSNYNFKPDFLPKSFTNEVLFFEPEANKKDSIFWSGIRPVPLTDEEVADYIKKDSIQVLRKSQVYLDSIDQKGNRLKVSSPIAGYAYANTFQKWRLNYEGVFRSLHFNTLQGWNVGTGISYSKWYDDNRTQILTLNSKVQYGLADERVRFTGSIFKRFNRVKRNTFMLSGGNKVQQFNASEPILPVVNTISSLFFERNYLKAYDLTFARVAYAQEFFNGLRFVGNLGYEKRQPLFNQSQQVVFRNKGVSYT